MRIALRRATTRQVARIAIFLCSAAAVVAFAGGAGASGGAARVASLETDVLVRINALRAASGAAPLGLQPGLVRAAERHSYDMVRNGYFGHDSADGSGFRARIADTYGRLPNSRWHVAENLAWRAGDAGASAVMSQWLASRFHRANLLDPRFRHAGIAAVRAPRAAGVFGGRAVTVVTLDLGRR